ncbi:NUDIX domain-containing protein [Microcoleus sp. PH2017_05_CCC_O_A]|uniref:NUDIX domain-containing protein n=1 Tax=Microcoleus sp. PH2017_05_CCC_O_A TaxID=2798816 RepID=UPI001D5AD95F|nr:NUDIX domain-containing protein [Microcoleus sp. PH2017_05_CCC_O_A]MCC3434349.1 NUDIX hydrolase [Microcoleus sp. PH2017_05_CCC_O_A]
MEPGETAEVALLRELLEEISWVPASASFFCRDVEGDIVRHVFHSQLTADVNDLVLHEGWDMQLLTAEDIRAGKCYSEKSGDVRPFGIPHQRILLNFIESI